MNLGWDTIKQLLKKAWTWTGIQTFSSIVATTADINGGTIDGTTIGATSATTGKFTTLQVTTGAVNGYVLQSNAAGLLSYADPAASANAGLYSLVNPKAPSQGVAMTYAASGSTGIQVADNDNIDFGTGNFTLVWKGSLPDWTPSEIVYFMNKSVGANGFLFYVTTAGILRVLLYRTDGGTSYSSTIATGFSDGTVHELSAVIARETDSAAGSVTFFVDGVQLGSSVEITAGAPGTISSSAVLYIMGNSVARHASTVHHAYLINFTPTAAEVLDMYRNGIPSKWFDQTGTAPAKQTALTAGTLVTGREYIIDTYVAGDDFTNVGAASNASGVRFVATGTTPTTWANSSSLRQIGVTFWMSPEGMQPAPGQCLDASGNKLHALQPASGSSLVRYKKEFEFRWTNTWAGSNATQYIGGLNQVVNSTKHFFDMIISRSTTTTATSTISFGDGSANDYYVAAVAPTTVPLIHTLAHNLNDGTNLKFTITPTDASTMVIETVAHGYILE
ncbi:MAG: hypothetical protein WC332_08520 [Clostridia bacterium]|jgi:hypothetical protein